MRTRGFSPRTGPKQFYEHVAREWPRWAQVAGLLLGAWQIVEWQIAGGEPNLGVMSFAGALLLFQRAASAHQRRTEGER